MDGGMLALILEQRLSVRCPSVNGPVSLLYHCHRDGTQKKTQPTQPNQRVYEQDQQTEEKKEKEYSDI